MCNVPEHLQSRSVLMYHSSFPAQSLAVKPPPVTNLVAEDGTSTNQNHVTHAHASKHAHTMLRKCALIVGFYMHPPRLALEPV